MDQSDRLASTNLFLQLQIMRLESWKERWVGGCREPASRSVSVDTESEHDEPSDLQLQLNSESSSPEVSQTGEPAAAPNS